MHELSLNEIGPIVGSSTLNLLRRGADGSLRMSADRWVLQRVEEELVVFESRPDDPAISEQELQLRLDEVERMTWDRLPRQQQRSQLRFHLKSGDLITFSGCLVDPPGAC